MLWTEGCLEDCQRAPEQGRGLRGRDPFDAGRVGDGHDAELCQQRRLRIVDDEVGDRRRRPDGGIVGSGVVAELEANPAECVEYCDQVEGVSDLAIGDRERVLAGGRAWRAVRSLFLIARSKSRADSSIGSMDLFGGNIELSRMPDVYRPVAVITSL
jgi:hypothetical protein